jgi:hypothetical protein
MEKASLFTPEENKRKDYPVEVLMLGSLGYGVGSISYNAKADEMTNNLLYQAERLINSGECLVDVEEQDDGCGDGRPADEVVFCKDDGQIEARPITAKSPVHERAKVFGGGYIISHVMDLALGRKSHDLDEDLKRGVDELDKVGIHCGVHTGQHRHAGAVDCGANDREAEILANALDPQLTTKIMTTAKSLAEQMNQPLGDHVLEKALNNFEAALADKDYFAKSSGKSRLRTVMEQLKAEQMKRGDQSHPLAVSKNLFGDHHEAYVVLNFAEGKTFSQKLFRQQLAEQFPDLPAEQLPQVFTTDFARIKKIAVAKTDNAADFQIALSAGLVYSIATAATLTDGSLPMYVAGQANETYTRTIKL